MFAEILGRELLAAKKSAVNEHGELHGTMIAGVQYRATRPVPHEDGHVTEVARANWDLLGGPVVQVHISTTFTGRVRAWGLHTQISDRLFVVSGLIKIAIYDGRKGSPTEGTINEFVVSEKNPALIIIPPNLYHGWKNIGTTEAAVINMPSIMYNHEAPDALDLPWDSEEAQKLIPYKW